MICKHRTKGRQATAAVEFAVFLVVLVPMLLGLWEIGRLVNVYQTLSSASRQGGRLASTGEKSTAEVQQFVLTYLKNAGFYRIKEVAANEAELLDGGKVFVSVKVYDSSGNLREGVDARDANQNEQVEVTVSILFSDVEYSPTNYFLNIKTTVSSTVVWNCMRDVPLVVNDTIPLY